MEGRERGRKKEEGKRWRGGKEVEGWDRGRKKWEGKRWRGGTEEDERGGKGGGRGRKTR